MATRTWTNEQLSDAVAGASNFQNVVRLLGLNPKGGGSAHIAAHVRRLGLSTSHFTNSRRSAYTFEETFCENSPSLNVTRQVIRLKLLLPRQCEVCENNGKHMGKPLTLQLDHRNGIGNDNRIINLRWLCPNCHSQTPTFCGRNQPNTLGSSNGRTDDFGSSNEGSNPSSRTKRKNKRKTKIKWPRNSKLERMVKSTPLTTIAKLLGVTSVAVCKHCKKMGIKTYGRGYWAKMRSKPSGQAGSLQDS